MSLICPLVLVALVTPNRVDFLNEIMNDYVEILS